MSSSAPTTDFDLPWCHALSADPTLHRIPTHSLIPQPTTESSLVAELLHNDRGIRDMRTYYRFPHSSVTDPDPTTPTEVLVLFSLGTGVNGIPHTCHGGLIGLMLDEVTGEFASRVFGRDAIVTGELTLRYKRRLSTPAVVLCRAWSEAEPGKGGKKVIVNGTVEDGVGGLYATGRVVFVKIGGKL